MAPHSWRYQIWFSSLKKSKLTEDLKMKLLTGIALLLAKTAIGLPDPARKESFLYKGDKSLYHYWEQLIPHSQEMEEVGFPPPVSLVDSLIIKIGLQEEGPKPLCQSRFGKHLSSCKTRNCSADRVFLPEYCERPGSPGYFGVCCAADAPVCMVCPGDNQGGLPICHTKACPGGKWRPTSIFWEEMSTSLEKVFAFAGILKCSFQSLSIGINTINFSPSFYLLPTIYLFSANIYLT